MRESVLLAGVPGDVEQLKKSFTSEQRLTTPLLVFWARSSAK